MVHPMSIYNDHDGAFKTFAASNASGWPAMLSRQSYRHSNIVLLVRSSSKMKPTEAQNDPNRIDVTPYLTRREINTRKDQDLIVNKGVVFRPALSYFSALRSEGNWFNTMARGCVIAETGQPGTNCPPLPSPM